MPMTSKLDDKENKPRGRDFACEESYIDFMDHPSRIVRLEWRYLRRPEHYKWTSHSMLEVHLNGGARTRLERFADRGFVETLFDDGKADILGDVYRGRSVSGNDLAKPMFIDDLSAIATEFVKTPYSLRRYNCHHFVRDLWNEAVVEVHRSRHYPDRVKSGVLRGVTLPFHRNDVKGQGTKNGRFSVSNSFGSMFCTGPVQSDGELLSDASSEDEEEDGSGEEGGEWQLDIKETPSAIPAGGRVHVSFRHEEAGRISGQFTALGRQSADFDLGRRHCEFVNRLKAGAVYLLEPGSSLIAVDGAPLQADANSKDGRRKSFSKWLPARVASAGGCEISDSANSNIDAGLIATRLAERAGAVDLEDLVRQLVRVMPWNLLQEDKKGQNHLRRLQSSPKTSPRSLQSLTIPGTKDPVVVDVCSVVLRGVTETRLAIYALLSAVKPARGERQECRQLRLLSGDVLSEEEGVFTYSLHGDAEKSVASTTAGSALDCVLGELEVLLTALATGDWGFITLK